MHKLGDKGKSEVSSIGASSPALPLCPSKEPTPPADLEGIDGTKDAHVTSRQPSHQQAPTAALGSGQSCAGQILSLKTEFGGNSSWKVTEWGHLAGRHVGSPAR